MVTGKKVSFSHKHLKGNKIKSLKTGMPLTASRIIGALVHVLVCYINIKTNNLLFPPQRDVRVARTDTPDQKQNISRGRCENMLVI